MSRIKMLAGLVSDENLFPTDDYLLDTASHAGRDKQAFQSLFIRGIIPFTGAQHSRSNHLSQAPPLNTVTPEG